MSLAPDEHWSLPRGVYPPLPRGAARRRSLAVRMPDGVRLAVNLWLPPAAQAGGRVPTLLHLTRYYRALALRPAARPLPLAERHDLYASLRPRALGAGYAWMDVDVRGSGASEGTHPHPWSEPEVSDGGHLVDWLCAQPFSDGRAGALGISYSGTAAEMLLRNERPAVRAVAPCFSLFDTFADVAFPGGLHLSWFTQTWSTFNQLLDRGEVSTALALALWGIAQSQRPWLARGRLEPLAAALGALPRERFLAALRPVLGAVVRGVEPLEEDRDGSLLREALAQHAANFDIHQGALRVTHRDDASLYDALPELTVDSFSPHLFAARARELGVAVYSLGGWRDASYPHAAAKRFGAVGGRLTLGPWGHVGELVYRPGQAVLPARFDQGGELLRFFDLHLRGRDAHGFGAEEPVHYFTSGEDRWKSAPAWPPPGSTTETLHLTPERGLACAPSESGSVELRFDAESAGGPCSRWRGLLGGQVRCDEPDQRARDAHRLCFDSDPLGAPLELTGHPMLRLWVRADARDAALFAYLEELLPDGRSVHLTEGQLRALHRAHHGDSALRSPEPWRSFTRADARPLEPGEPAELCVDLLPLSHRVGRGSRLRLALALGDRELFAPVPQGARSLAVLCAKDFSSRLELPVQL